jgi:hypothetical protein
MFMLLSKFLPIQDLSVEEMLPRPDPRDVATIKAAYPEKHIRFDKQFDMPKPTRQHGERGKAVDLTRGVNAVIMSVLSDGKKHTPLELRDAMEKTVYSPSGLGSRLERLRHFGFIHNPRKGEWAATLKGLDGFKQSESAA